VKFLVIQEYLEKFELLNIDNILKGYWFGGGKIIASVVGRKDDNSYIVWEVYYMILRYTV
jgi:hypothetical protein